jgi:hypothetical protein
MAGIFFFSRFHGIREGGRVESGICGFPAIIVIGWVFTNMGTTLLIVD